MQARKTREIESWGLVVAGAWHLCAPVWLAFADTPVGIANIAVGAVLLLTVLTLPPCPRHWRNTPYLALGAVPTLAMMLYQPVSGPMLVVSMLGSAGVVVFSLRPTRRTQFVPLTPPGEFAPHELIEPVSASHASAFASSAGQRMFESNIIGIAPH